MAHEIEIHTRTTDTATIDGQLVQRGHYATIYDAALAHVVTRAQEVGRPVLAKATDGVDTGQTFWIAVAPDGSVDAAEPPPQQPADTALTPATRTAGRRRRTEPDDVDESDFYTSVGSTAVQPLLPTPPVPVVESVPCAPAVPTPESSASHPIAAMQDSPVTAGESPAIPPAPQVQDQPPVPVREPEPKTGPIHIPHPGSQPSVIPPREPYASQGPAGDWPRPEQPPHHGAPSSPVPAEQWHPQIQAVPPAAPSLADLRASRPDAPEAPATTGWRGGFNRATGGLLKLSPSDDELRLRRARDAVQRSLRGPRTVVVINTKGGGGKTTAVYSLAATFGQARGGYVLGWDNNETRGTLAWRSAPARHTNTAVDLLRDLERFEDPRNARVGDLDNYVRAQGSAQFDVLASDENAASAASIDGDAFRALHRSLSRFYRILVVDTGNNVKAPNWQAAVELADQLVVVSSIREDTAGGASWTLDHLAEIGHGDKVRNAVTILSAPKAAADPDQRALHTRFREHFAARTRTVLDVPFDPALVDGDSIVFEALSPSTRQAWLIAAAAIAEGL